MEHAPDRRRRVAIACQGGGSHTAFTAGVLKGLLGGDALSSYEIVGLSGTSGGAVCALLAWYALLDDDPAAAGGCSTPSGPTTPPPRRSTSCSTRGCCGQAASRSTW
jgi:hypothetical protein